MYSPGCEVLAVSLFCTEEGERGGGGEGRRRKEMDRWEGVCACVCGGGREKRKVTRGERRESNKGGCTCKSEVVHRWFSGLVFTKGVRTEQQTQGELSKQQLTLHVSCCSVSPSC